MTHSTFPSTAASMATAFLALSSFADGGAQQGNSEGDWAQWRGPNRDGVSIETGLLTTWPEAGPEVLWRSPIGGGYAGVVIAAGRLYTMAGQGPNEFVLCLDAATGEEVWRFRSDSNFIKSHGNGPRSTPTVDGSRLYVQSTKGKLYALDAKTGNKIWVQDLRRKFGSEIPRWGFAASALIEGDLLLLPVGGTGDQFMAAFDKHSGEVMWTSHADPLAYSSPIAITALGRRQIVFVTEHNLVSVSPSDGSVYWTHPWSGAINIATPIFVPDDRIFVSSAYGKGASMVRLKEADSGLAVEEVWMSTIMKNWINSSVLHEGYLYGFDSSIFKCIKADTGEEQWKQRGFERGSLILVDGHLIALGESGNLAVVEATPEEYREKASFQVFDSKCWTQPTFLGGRLYVRDEEELVCLNVSAAGI